MFRKCEARLQQFGSEPSSSAADEKVKRNVQVGLPRGLGSGCTGQSVLRNKECGGLRGSLRQLKQPGWRGLPT